MHGTLGGGMGIGSPPLGWAGSPGAGWPAIWGGLKHRAPQASASAQPSIEKVFPPACLSGPPAAHSSGGGSSLLSSVPQELHCPPRSCTVPQLRPLQAHLHGHSSLAGSGPSHRPGRDAPPLVTALHRHPGSSACFRLCSETGLSQPSQSSNTADGTARPAFLRVQGESTFLRNSLWAPPALSSASLCSSLRFILEGLLQTFTL